MGGKGGAQSPACLAQIQILSWLGAQGGPSLLAMYIQGREGGKGQPGMDGDWKEYASREEQSEDARKM